MHRATPTMRDLPGVLLTATVWAYWLGVGMMIVGAHRNEDASAQRSEKIGTVWALRAQLSEIFRSHVLDGRMRLAQPIEAPGLECPHGLIVAEQLHEMRTDECLAMPTVHNEQRRLAAAAPQGNEHRNRAGAC